MKRSVIGLFVLLCGTTTFAKDGQKVSSVPDQFLIARHTFFDFGPPSDFYEIISVRGTGSGTTIERSRSSLLVTPVSNPQKLKRYRPLFPIQ